MGASNIQELALAIGFKRQSELQDILGSNDCWSLAQTGTEIGQTNLITESNADDIGKGDEWATQLYKSHRDSAFPWTGRLTSEAAAMLFVFGTSSFEKAAAGTGFSYTCLPADPVADGIEVFSTTVAQAIRQGQAPVFDLGLIGMCLQEFTISLRQGPGRDNAVFTSNWVGCGKYASPSGITVPGLYDEHPLNAGNCSIEIMGTDYTVTKRFVSCDFGWRNNLRLESGYYPGSGTQDGAQLRGRMRFGKREVFLNFVAEFENGSTELEDFLALEEGTAAISATGGLVGEGPTVHSMSATFHRVVFRSVVIGNTDGIVTVACECQVLKDAEGDVVTFVAVCEQDNIGSAPAA